MGDAKYGVKIMHYDVHSISFKSVNIFVIVSLVGLHKYIYTYVVQRTASFRIQVATTHA